MRRKPVISKEVLDAAAREGVNVEQALRQVLKLPPIDRGWTVKEVHFPEGTLFRCWWKDRPWWGEVRDGGLWINDKRYTTPSEATTVFTQPPVNGWRVWEAKLPNTRTWVNISDMRHDRVLSD